MVGPNAVAVVSTVLGGLAAVASIVSANASKASANATKDAADATKLLTEIERERRADEVERREAERAAEAAIHAAGEWAKGEANLSFSMVRQGLVSSLIVHNDGPARAQQLFVEPRAAHNSSGLPNYQAWPNPLSIPAGGSQSMTFMVDLRMEATYGIHGRVRWIDGNNENHDEPFDAWVPPEGFSG